MLFCIHSSVNCNDFVEIRIEIMNFLIKVAQQKLYEHWKQNAPELRQVSAGEIFELICNKYSGFSK